MDAYHSRSYDADDQAAAFARTALEPERPARKLELSPEDLEEAFAIAQLGVWHWVVGTQEMSWSAEMFRIAGRDPATFQPTFDNVLACMHPDDRAGTRDRLFAAARQEHAQGYEFRLLRPDGSVRQCWARIRPVAEGTCVHMLRGVLLDITDRRQMEAALAASEENYRNTLELNPQIPWTAGPDGQILDAGLRWAEQIDAEQGKWYEALHPGDSAVTLAAWEHSVATGEPLDVRYRLRLRCGEYRWFRARAGARRDSEGQIIRWYGLLEDIEEQVAAEAANREREEWILNAHEAAGIGLFEVDFVHGAARLSPQSLALHGLPRAGAAELDDWADWSRLIHPDDAELGRERVKEAAVTGLPYDFTFRVPLSDGSFRWINGLGRVQHDETGRPLRLLGVNMDVSARKIAELKLEESEALNRTIVETSPDSIKLLDPDGTVLFANGGSVTSMELQDASTVLGRKWQSLWPRAASVRVEQALATALAGGYGRFSAARETALGTPKWWDVLMSPVVGEDGQVQRIVAISRDITQQKHAEERIQWSATHDALTHLPNRRLFEERLASAIEEAQNTGCHVGLLAIDLDNLKQVNDTLGHDAGNAILRVLGKRLARVIGPGATAARLGGDEFAVVLPKSTGAVALHRLAEKILTALRLPFTYEGSTLDCRASIGASLFPDDAREASDLLKQADLALYSSKSRRGGLQMFEPRMRAEIQQRISMINIARDALAGNRVRTFFQPKVNLANGTIGGFEALLRWEDPRGGLHLPGTISAAFEDADLSLAISDRVFDLTLGVMRQWIDAGVPFGSVAINAAAADLRRRDFARWLLGKLEAARVPPELLQLEVTETVFLGRAADQAEEELKLLSGHGVRIALDDFGTGYASLSHLKQYPVDVIKIDRGFVCDIREDQDESAIVSAILDLGRALKIEVVAEGVETEFQARRLRRLGCRYVQGFLFSEAVPAERVPELLKRSFKLPRVPRPCS